jgi:hypothetical protein
MAAVLGLALIAASAVYMVGLRGDLGDARAALSTTRGELGSTRQDLASTQADLSTSESNLSSANATIGTCQAAVNGLATSEGQLAQGASYLLKAVNAGIFTAYLYVAQATTQVTKANQSMKAVMPSAKICKSAGTSAL